MVIFTAAGTLNQVPDVFVNNINPVAALPAFSDKIHALSPDFKINRKIKRDK
ncbi:MAG: hypothetical protein FWE78_05640 [Methanimicrococcus sp.]|nr:hypothetical protein [Methanimicrococcus sp.]